VPSAERARERGALVFYLTVSATSGRVTRGIGSLRLFGVLGASDHAAALIRSCSSPTMPIERGRFVRSARSTLWGRCGSWPETTY
jgi:hypothetical protein